jgi:hypothetical protein
MIHKSEFSQKGNLRRKEIWLFLRIHSCDPSSRHVDTNHEWPQMLLVFMNENFMDKISCLELYITDGMQFQ